MKISKSLIGIIAAVVIIGAWAVSAYNSLVAEQEKATTAFANVQSAYQRRADLIPNLVETVKGYASHEKQTLEDVVNARTKATNENFRDLQVQLEGTENRINEARNKFNSVVQNYNMAVRSFPKNIMAGIFGFDKMDKFEADAGAEKAPKVQF